MSEHLLNLTFVIDSGLIVVLDLIRILDNSITDFDLLLKTNNGIILYAGAPYHWKREELMRLLHQGHNNLYYSTSDQVKVEAYLALTAVPEVDRSLPPAQRILNITDVGAALTKVLYQYPLTSTALRQGENVAEALVACIQEDITCVKALGLLAHHDDYTYYHSGRVAAYSLAIALRLSLANQKMLESLALGCVLHDIGKAHVPLEVLLKPGILTEQEWVVIKKHPEYGHTMIDSSNVSVVTKHIILYHHERMDGSGYPHGISGNELLPEVKIAAFADVFDALTTNRPYHKSRSKFEALDFIRFKLLHNLDKDVFRALVDIMK